MLRQPAGHTWRGLTGDIPNQRAGCRETGAGRGRMAEGWRETFRFLAASDQREGNRRLQPVNFLTMFSSAEIHAGCSFKQGMSV
jgi:hypothetical protein